MNDKEVLQKAIEIAIKNGYDFYFNEILVRGNGMIQVIQHGSIPYSSEEIIFSHSFAEAFWGNGEDISSKLFPKRSRFKIHMDSGEEVIVNSKEFTAWEFHLQVMILCTNPIDYLRKFINLKSE